MRVEGVSCSQLHAVSRLDLTRCADAPAIARRSTKSVSVSVHDTRSSLTTVGSGPSALSARNFLRPNSAFASSEACSSSHVVRPAAE
jgi:hypothetical protein